MRVCLVSSSLHPVPVAGHGAVETQMMEHARGLAANGHDVRVITVGEGEQITSDTAEGVRFHRLGAAYENADHRGAWGLPRSQVQFGLRAWRLIKTLNPHIVHCHSRYPCLIGVSGRAGRWRTIYHAHNWKLAERMDYPILSPRRAATVLGAGVDRRIARRCDHVIGVSKFIKRRIVATAGIPADRVSVVTNVVDGELFRPEPPAPGRRGILFVGRIAAEKGVDTLIESMVRVASAVPEAQLSIVGPNHDGTERGPYSNHCKRLVERLGLQERVRFAGAVPNRELPAMLRSSRLLVVPSIWGEPCGIVVLEGLACGVPVVASRVGGIPELIDEGRTGLLVSPADPNALGSSLVRALHDDELHESAARLGPAVVARRHAWNSIGARLESIYDSVLGTAEK